MKRMWGQGLHGDLQGPAEGEWQGAGSLDSTHSRIIQESGTFWAGRRLRKCFSKYR